MILESVTGAVSCLVSIVMHYVLDNATGTVSCLVSIVIPYDTR